MKNHNSGRGVLSTKHYVIENGRSFDHVLYVARSIPWQNNRNLVIPSAARAYWFSCTVCDQLEAYAFMLRKRTQ